MSPSCPLSSRPSVAAAFGPSSAAFASKGAGAWGPKRIARRSILSCSVWPTGLPAAPAPLPDTAVAPAAGASSGVVEDAAGFIAAIDAGAGDVPLGIAATPGAGAVFPAAMPELDVLKEKGENMLGVDEVDVAPKAPNVAPPGRPPPPPPPPAPPNPLPKVAPLPKGGGTAPEDEVLAFALSGLAPVVVEAGAVPPNPKLGRTAPPNAGVVVVPNDAKGLGLLLVEVSAAPAPDAELLVVAAGWAENVEGCEEAGMVVLLPLPLPGGFVGVLPGMKVPARGLRPTVEREAGDPGIPARVEATSLLTSIGEADCEGVSLS